MTSDAFRRTEQGFAIDNEERLQAVENRNRRSLGTPRGDTVARNAYFGTPTTDADRAQLANAQVRWFNTDLGWEESYYATTGLSGLTAKGLIAGVAPGWYPVGTGPYCNLEPTTTFGATPGNYIGAWNGFVRRSGGSAWFAHNTNGITLNVEGLYDLSWWTLQQANPPQTDYHTRLMNPAFTAVDWMSNQAGPTPIVLFTRAGAEYRSVHVRAGQHFRVLLQAGTVTLHNVTGGTTYPSMRGQMCARYVGPALESS